MGRASGVAGDGAAEAQQLLVAVLRGPRPRKGKNFRAHAGAAASASPLPSAHARQVGKKGGLPSGSGLQRRAPQHMHKRPPAWASGRAERQRRAQEEHRIRVCMCKYARAWVMGFLLMVDGFPGFGTTGPGPRRSDTNLLRWPDPQCVTVLAA